ncbi:hypothetical protein ES319_1Z043500v1 [Gossypium barbadense]|uniref:Uncharacterized protein n=1 Tax=Gossypium barbadense TaxID=3634 RepID=A0A5J5NAB0_GOSBA|nr:hypothetical protein ES319_1Z043500v1 [Gossypium barbadense]
MVDPANTPLGKMLLEEITPVVMVLCTPLVEESCLKNGLSFVQMLSPFCDFTNIDVPVRTASDQPYRLHKFKLRLFYASDIWQPNLEVAKERLKQVITKAGEDDFPEISSDLPQVNDLLSRHESEILPTWFQFFNKELKLGSPVQQNATRCGFWWIEMLKTRNQIKEAATVYFRICGEDLLHSAVMLEQASFCYLLSKPPMLHKYGFHLVLSGDHYKKCDQIKHAICTYRNAVSVYRGTTWNLIKDRVHFHIGQWYASLGMYDVAVTHMLEILASSHQSKTSQELFLRDFLHIVQAHLPGPKKETKEPIPADPPTPPFTCSATCAAHVPSSSISPARKQTRNSQRKERKKKTKK